MADRVVTISVSYPVTPGEEGEFEVWSRLRLAETADRPGYLGGQVLAPPAPGPDWFIVHRFENERAASDWESWFRGSPGWQQAGDIEWKFDRPGEPARGGADRRRSGADGAGARRAAVLPQRPYTAAPDARPPEQRNGPNGARRPAGPPPIESRPRPQNGAARSTPPAAPPAEPPPSQAASIVVTIAVIVLFTAVFETVVAPLLAGGPILLRIVLLSVVITLAVTAVRPPGLRRWLANLLVPVAVRRRNEDGRDQPR